MKKGEIIEGVIEEVRYPNRGILHFDGTAVEVKNVIPGQKVRARITRKRNGKAEAVLLEVLEKAPGELEPPCPAFGKCGGCSYLNLSYHQELTLKQIQVMKLLQQGLEEGWRLCASVSTAEGQERPQRPDWTFVQNWYEGIHSSPRIFGYRNKMEFTFGDEVKGGPMTLGMHRRGSFHDIVDAGSCVIVDEDFRKIVNTARSFFGEREIPFYHRFSQQGYLRHLVVRKAAHTGEILIDLVTTSPRGLSMSQGGGTASPLTAAVPALAEEQPLTDSDHRSDPAAGAADSELVSEEQQLLQDFASAMEGLPLEGNIAGILHTKNDAVSDTVEDQGTEILYGRDYFVEELLHLKFKITPFSFFQTNSYGAETLYTIVRQYIMKVVPPVYDGTGASAKVRPLIYDLYCGTGTISQLVAPVARKVIGVEIVEEAVEAARENAERNGVKNCEFLAGDVLKVLDTIEEKPDLIILDPPRDGIHPKALPKILAYGVDYILYISCKPTSLARDLPAFIAAGYHPVEGCSVDQFTWTTGVETVVLMSRRKD